MNNSSQISITITSDQNAEAVFEQLKALGVLDANLSGNTVTGTASDNLVNPLRSVQGVASVVVTSAHKPKMEAALGHPNMGSPNLFPPNQPAPSIVPDPKV